MPTHKSFGTRFGDLVTAAKHLVTSPPLLPDTYRDPQTFWQFLSGHHSFARRSLLHLVETGYSSNSDGNSVINKIVLAQKELIITPTLNGDPLDKIKIPFDVNKALLMLLTTGTVAIWKRQAIGFADPVFEVMNTVFLQETATKFGFKYKYIKNKFLPAIDIPEEDIIFIRFLDIGRNTTNFGLSPLQVAIMPLETLTQMYKYDAATLKNGGVKGMLTNDSETPITGIDSDQMQEEANRRLDALGAGQIAASTSKVRFLDFGKTAKDMSLWDGYSVKLRSLCNVLQVDSSLWNDPENKKFLNLNEARKTLYTGATIPYTRMIVEDPELVAAVGFDMFIDDSNIDVLQKDQAQKNENNQTRQSAIIELNEQVRSKLFTPEIAIQILVMEWGYDEDEAKAYINDALENEVIPTPEVQAA